MSLGSSRTFHKKFKFIVEIDSFNVAFFQKCSELSAEIEEIQYSEGGTLIPDKSPGRVKVADITIERACCADNDMYAWFSQVIDFTSDTGLKEAAIKRNFDIVQQDRDGTELRRWTITGAWPKKFVAGDWDNESDELTMETATLAIDTFVKSGGV